MKTIAQMREELAAKQAKLDALLASITVADADASQPEAMYDFSLAVGEGEDAEYKDAAAVMQAVTDMGAEVEAQKTEIRDAVATVNFIKAQKSIPTTVPTGDIPSVDSLTKEVGSPSTETDTPKGKELADFVMGSDTGGDWVDRLRTQKAHVPLAAFGMEAPKYDYHGNVMADATIAVTPFQRPGVVQGLEAAPQLLDLVPKIAPPGGSSSVTVWSETGPTSGGSDIQAAVRSSMAETAIGTSLPEQNLTVTTTSQELVRRGGYAVMGDYQYRNDARARDYINQRLPDLLRMYLDDYIAGVLENTTADVIPSGNRISSAAAVRRQTALRQAMGRVEMVDAALPYLAANARTVRAIQGINNGSTGYEFNNAGQGLPPGSNIGGMPIVRANRLSNHIVMAGDFGRYAQMYITPTVAVSSREVTPALNFTEDGSSARTVPGSLNLTGQVAIIVEVYTFFWLVNPEGFARVNLTTDPNSGNGGAAGYVI